MSEFADQLAPADSRTVRRVAREIDSLDTALRAQAREKTNPAALAALDSVLLDSRFHPSQNVFQTFGAWLWRPIQWVLDRVQSLLQSVSPGNAVPGTVTLLFAVVLLLTVAGLSVVLARAALAHMASEYVPMADGVEPQSSNAASVRSAEYEATGDYRSALRYLLLATLLDLRDRGILDWRPSLTNREHLQRLQIILRDHPAGEAFRELVDLFDKCWYGHLPIDRELYDRALSLSQQVRLVRRERSA